VWKAPIRAEGCLPARSLLWKCECSICTCC
jgi:hypothetical protein